MFAPVEPSAAELARLEAMSDAELVLVLKSGRDEALGVLLRRHSDALYRFCCHLMPNRADAEDIAQEAMTRAMMRADALQTGSAFRSWLFSIARNLSVDSYRSRKRLTSLPEDEDSSPIMLYQDSPYEQVETHEEYQTVAEALGKLARSHQTVLMMREVEGLSYAEIAERLDVSQSAVETLLFRARRRLKEEYRRQDAPVPAFGLVAGLRGLLARLASPFASAPLAAKAVVGALVLGGALTAPRAFNAVLGAHHVALARAGQSATSAPSAATQSGGNAPAVQVTPGAGRGQRAASATGRQGHPVARGIRGRSVTNRITGAGGRVAMRRSGHGPAVVAAVGVSHATHHGHSNSGPSGQGPSGAKSGVSRAGGTSHGADGQTRSTQTGVVGAPGTSAQNGTGDRHAGSGSAHTSGSGASSSRSNGQSRSNSGRAIAPVPGQTALPTNGPRPGQSSPKGSPSTGHAGDSGGVAGVKATVGAVTSPVTGAAGGAVATVVKAVPTVVGAVPTVVKAVPTAVKAVPTAVRVVPTAVKGVTTVLPLPTVKPTIKPTVVVPTVGVKVPTAVVKVPTALPTPSLHIP